MKEKLIEAGGKLWEPNERISRIYLNDEAISKAFGWKLVEKAKYLEQFESIGKAKVWYDCKKILFTLIVDKSECYFADIKLICLNKILSHNL